MNTTSIPVAVYNEYFKALLSGNSNACKSIADSLLNQGSSIYDLYELVFRPSLYQIGDLWAKNEITVADEHIATAITENIISQLLANIEDKITVDKRVLVSCVTSDQHQVGAKMVAGLFELWGWESFYLGANMPISDLLESIQRLQPDVVCLSMGLVEHLKILEVTIREIRIIHPQTPIFVGGSAFSILELSQLGFVQTPHVHLVLTLKQLEKLISDFG